MSHLQLEIGKNLQDEGKVGKAIQIYKKAMKLNPHLPEINHRLAVHYHIAGNYAKALILYRRAIRQKPTFDLLLQSNYKKLLLTLQSSKVTRSNSELSSNGSGYCRCCFNGRKNVTTGSDGCLKNGAKFHNSSAKYFARIS